MFEIPYGLKSDVGQRARLLLAPASPSYNNKKVSPIKKLAISASPSKGQIISEAIFLVLNSSKKQTKNFCPSS
jgi:hypothetical protein